MRKHTYESAVIINAALEDEQIDAIAARLGFGDEFVELYELP